MKTTKTTAFHSKSPLLALGAYTCWVLADTCLKLAGTTLPNYEVVSIVGLAEVGLLLAWGLASGNLASLWPRRPARQVLRSTLDLVNNLCVVVAVRHLPLALFYILVFFAPIVTTVLAALWLGEGLGWKKTLPVVTGLLGVVIAVQRPGMHPAGQWIGVLACLVCVSCFATNIVWSRRLTQTETPQSMALFSGIVMLLAGFAAVALGAHAPSVRQVLVLSSTGLFSVLGGLCFFIALRTGSAAGVAQYHYSQLVTGALLAWLLFGETPTRAMYLGALVIIASASYAATLGRQDLSPIQLPEPL